MKKLTLGVFASREDAESAIGTLHKDLKVAEEEISYLYRNTNDEVKEVAAGDVSTGTPVEGAKTGAMVGGAAGAIAGIATVAGIIPVIGPIFAAGPLLTMLGIGAGAVGTTAAGALTGAAAGGLIGALVNAGVSETKAKEYEDRVMAGDVLVSVHAEEGIGVEDALREAGALSVESYMPAV